MVEKKLETTVKEENVNGEDNDKLALVWKHVSAVPLDLKIVAKNILNIRNAKEIPLASLLRLTALGFVLIVSGWFVSMYLSAFGFALFYYCAVSDAITRMPKAVREDGNSDRDDTMKCDSESGCDCGDDCENRKDGRCCGQRKAKSGSRILDAIRIASDPETGKLVIDQAGSSIIARMASQAREFVNEFAYKANQVIDEVAQTIGGAGFGGKACGAGFGGKMLLGGFGG